MAVEKTQAIILKSMPYRETSGILYLLTEHHGIVHGIAKGLRKQKSTTAFFERGFTIECLLYTKPHRDMHTLADMQVLQFFPGLRKNLLCSALRDTAFETILKTITSAYPYPELYALTLRLLHDLNAPAIPQTHITMLWWFYRDFIAITGFELNSRECLTCLRPLLATPHGAYLITSKGGFICKQCSPLNTTGTYLSAPTLQLLFGASATAEPTSEYTASDAQRITRLLAAYSQYHSNTNADCKALHFLETLLEKSGYPAET